jgi:hypothetical protein
MLKEMCRSTEYVARTIKLEEATGWEILKPPTLEAALALADDDGGLSDDEVDIEIRDDSDYVPDPEYTAAVEENWEYREETTRAALAMYLMELGLAKIEAVFEITVEVPPYCNQFVILLKDKSHICTCLEIVNKGIPCGHFFRAMRHDRRVQYHIRMVLLRWFREDKQDDPDLVEKIKELPFTLSTTHNISITGAIPDRRYLSDYSTVVPRAEVVARARKPLPNNMQLFAILQGRFKGISQDAVKSKEAYEHVHRALDELNTVIASIAVEEHERRETKDMQRSYRSNSDSSNNNKDIVYRLDDDNVTKSSRHSDNKIGSGTTLRSSPGSSQSSRSNRGHSRNLSRSPSCRHTQDPGPAPTLADDANYGSDSSDLSSVKNPLCSKRIRNRSADTDSDIESQIDRDDASQDSRCIDPITIRGRGRSKSTRYKPLVERQRKGMIESTKSLTPKRKRRACGRCGGGNHNMRTCKK